MFKQNGPAVAGAALVSAFVAGVLPSSSTYAQPVEGTASSPEGSVPTMTLDEARTFAKAHQPVLAAAKSSIAALEVLARVPKASWLPHIEMGFSLLGGTSNNTTASYLAPYGVAIPRIGGTKAISTNDLTLSALEPYPSSLAALSLDQEIYDFGRISAQTAALQALTDVERARADVDVLDAGLAVDQAYFAVQGAHAVLAAAKAAEARAVADRDRVVGAITGGMRPPSDRARADADVAKAAVGTIRAEGSLELAQGTLAAVVGSAVSRVDASEAQLQTKDLPPLPTALAEGQRHDPEVAMDLAQVRAQAANTAALGSERRPNLVLSSTVSGRAGGAPLAGDKESFGYGLLPLIPNWDVGVVLSVPIFDGVTRAKEDASRAREDAYRDEANVVKQRGVEQIERSYYEARAARDALPALERARDAAQAAHDQAEAQLATGSGTAVDLAEAQALLTESEVALAVGRYDVSRADASLARAMAVAR